MNKTQGREGRRERKGCSRITCPFQQKKSNKWCPVVFMCNLDPLMMTSYWKQDSLNGLIIIMLSLIMVSLII